MTREPTVPATLSIHSVAPELCISAFRTVRVGSLDDPALRDSFRSHYEEGLAPRYRQTEHAATHMAVSFWRSEETCRVLAKKFPKHGSHIARVLLTFGNAFDYLDPALEINPEHLTIWASPDRLAAGNGVYRSRRELKAGCNALRNFGQQR